MDGVPFVSSPLFQFSELDRSKDEGRKRNGTDPDASFPLPLLSLFLLPPRQQDPRDPQPIIIICHLPLQARFTTLFDRKIAL